MDVVVKHIHAFVVDLAALLLVNCGRVVYNKHQLRKKENYNE